MTGLEAWFSSMAEQGLYLEKINHNRAYFRPGTPKRGVRYALDVTGPMDIDRERNENYAQMGWNYVSTLVNFYYVYRSDGLDTPALHTDPVTQSKTITPLIRRSIRALILSVLALLLGFRGTLIAIYSNPWFLFQYLLLRTEYALLFALFLIPCVFLLLIPQIRQLRALGKLRRQLANGIPLDPNRRWPRKISPTLLKHVYQMIPVSLYDIPGLEQWLEGQAVHGLFPVHLGSYASFRRDGIPGTRFRLEPFENLETGPSQEQLELYHDAGWEYACPVGRRLYSLFYCADRAAPELHTDPVTRGFSLDWLAKRTRKSFRHLLLSPLILLLLILLPAVLSAWIFHLQLPFLPQPDYRALMPILLLRLSPLLALTPYFLLNWLQELGQLRLLLRLRKTLADGIDPVPQPSASRRWRRLWNLVQIAMTAVLILTFLAIKLYDRPIPVEQATQPYLSLETLEGISLTPTPDFRDQKENQLVPTLTPLAPVYYSVEQSGYDPSQGKSGSFSPAGAPYQYSPSLDMTYFHLLFPAMARSVAKAQMAEYRPLNVTYTYHTVDYPGLDFILLARSDDGISQMAAMARDGRVAVFSYRGLQQLEDHLALLAEMVL